MISHTKHYGNTLDPWFFNKCLELWSTGEIREGRNGRTHSEFGTQLRIDLRGGFPALTLKRMNTQASFAEMLGFMRGFDNAFDFSELGCNFWKANSESDYWMANPNRPEAEGSLGRIYGVQWRDWRGIGPGGEIRHVDQLETLLHGLRTDPYGRRHIVNAWQPAELDQMALPPCHTFFQVYCHNDGGLSLQMYQRSCDIFLGVPFNITGYAFMTHMLASMTGRHVRDLIMNFGDLHLYDVHQSENHVIDCMEKSLSEGHSYALPVLQIPDLSGESFARASTDNWASLAREAYFVENYESGPFIPAQMVA